MILKKTQIMSHIKNKTIKNRKVLQFEMELFLKEVRKSFEIECLLSSIKHSEANYINNIIDQLISHYEKNYKRY